MVLYDREMKKEITAPLLKKLIEEFERKPFHELVALISGEPITEEFKHEDGIVYQTEVCVYWDDDNEMKDIRAICCIDDGGFLSSNFPHSCDTLIEHPIQSEVSTPFAHSSLTEAAGSL